MTTPIMIVFIHDVFRPHSRTWPSRLTGPFEQQPPAAIN
jgi:hypothetical protein